MYFFTNLLTPGAFNRHETAGISEYHEYFTVISQRRIVFYLTDSRPSREAFVVSNSSLFHSLETNQA